MDDKKRIAHLEKQVELLKEENESLQRYQQQQIEILRQSLDYAMRAASGQVLEFAKVRSEMLKCQAKLAKKEQSNEQ